VDYSLPAGYEHVYSGKVRELYRSPEGRLLFVATDRISAYDWILPTPIPDKGRILTQLSLWWFDQFADIVPHHVLSTHVPDAVAGRALLCQELDMMPVECVVRGYLAGSGYSDYLAERSICGNGLPPGLREGDRLPKPLFTPATKAAQGEHDENITYDETIVLVGQEEAQDLKRLSLDVYRRAAAIADRVVHRGEPVPALERAALLRQHVLRVGKLVLELASPARAMTLAIRSPGGDFWLMARP
jgi:phosphoribosylaminoimidazole-succinocarboxamide synthase